MSITSFTGKNAFLNTFYSCSITTSDNLTYPALENAFQASRCVYKTDKKRFTTITPGDAKKLGGEVTTKPGWKERQIEEMRQLLSIKFEDKALSLMLLKTGDEELLYTNTWHDTFWGICDGTGSNHLGKLLMELRDSLRKDYEGSSSTPKQLALIRSDEETVAHSCYMNSLILAHENGCRSIAFPSISTGIYGYPLEEAARVAIKSVKDFIKDNPGAFDSVKFVLFDQKSYDIYCELLNPIKKERCHDREMEM